MEKGARGRPILTKGLLKIHTDFWPFGRDFWHLNRGVPEIPPEIHFDCMKTIYKN